MKTYYVRRWSDGEIVNAITTAQSLVALEASWPFDDDCYPDAHPPLSVLQRYRYYWERP